MKADLPSLVQEVRQAARGLSREPRFALTALAILGLCFAANVAIFALVHDVLLSPLPFREADRLVTVVNRYPKAGVERAGASVPHYLERRQGIAAFENAAAFRFSGVTLGEKGAPDRVDAANVTPSFFPTLKATPALGRTFTEEEGFYGKNNVAVISDALWKSRFGGDPKVVGATLRINTDSYTVIGVMPKGFRYLNNPADLWTPLCFSDDERGADRRHSNGMEMIARLKPGVTVAEAQAQINALNQSSLPQDPYRQIVEGAGFNTTVSDLHGDTVNELRPVLLLLQAGVLFLQLIGAVNLANLLLVRASGREKEFGIKQALGADGWQLARSLVFECVVLSVAGAVFGLALGEAALRLIGALISSHFPVPVGGLSLGVCLWTLLASLGFGLLLALPVVWHILRGSLAETLSVESRSGTTSRAAHRLRHTLIVAQIALAFVLLSGAGLLGLSFERVLASSPGFRPEQVLTARVDLPWKNYQKRAQRSAFVERLLAELGTLPGVRSAGITSNVPFGGSHNNSAIWVEGRVLGQGESLQAFDLVGVRGDYLKCLGVPLREGRFLEESDQREGVRNCLVDEGVAKRYWPEGGALGHRLFNEPPEKGALPYTIVGVVGSVKQEDLADDKSRGAVYLPYVEQASLGFLITVRTELAPETAGAAMRAAVLRIDPELPLHDVRPMESRIDGSLSERRLPLALALAFAGIALVLAAAGIYGVLAYAVAQRRREIGVRLALGAQPEQILRQFLGLGLKLLAFALPLGLVGALLSGRAMSGLLFGVSATDPLVLGLTALALGAVALLACVVPSRVASRVHPCEALRSK